MKPPDRREQDRLKTRSAILDATEQLMRDEGYAAVTSRRVAERAHLKSQLVHYHFGTMDELFQEAYRRNEKRHFARHIELFKSAQTLSDLWALMSSPEGMEVVSEYVAAANHHKNLADMLTQSWANARMIHNAMLGKLFEAKAIQFSEMTPNVLRFVLSSVSRTLTEEQRFGFSEGHAEVIAYMEAQVERLEGPAEPERSKRTAPRSAKARATSSKRGGGDS